MNRVLYFILFFCLSSQLFAQTPTQKISGQIKDVLQNNLIGVTVEIKNDTRSFLLQSNTEGRFDTILEVGHYQINYYYPGYQVQRNLGIELRSGKQVFQKIVMTPIQVELEEISISASQEFIEVAPQISISMETYKYAASFDDLARTNFSRSGFSVINDQSNHFSYRGNSPNGIRWQLNDLDIVNPNHTSNSGTNNDLATRSGGGVSMLSTHMMNYGDFKSNENSLGGIYNMYLKDGNKEKNEYTFQAGLIGLDVAMEGPVSKNKTSFTSNARYSTLGLLSALGVDLGDEQISFQDLAAQVHIPTSRGEIKIFGLGGNSRNKFQAKENPEDRKEEKDLKDIADIQDMAGLGIRIKQSLDKSFLLNAGLLYSSRFFQRDVSFYDSDLNLLRRSLRKENESQLSSFVKLNYVLNATVSFQAGLRHRRFYENLRSERRSFIEEAALSQYFSSVQLYFRKHRFKAGLTLNSFNENKESFLAPHFSYTFYPTDRLAFVASYFLSSQIQDPNIRYATNENSNLLMSKAHKFNIGFHYWLNPLTQIRVAAYQEYLYDMPVGNFGLEHGMNFFNEAFQIPFLSDGKGRNQGVEIELSKRIKKGFYYHGNLTLFSSQYEDVNGDLLDSRFANNYLFNLMIGKEFDKIRPERKRTFGINVFLNLTGGFNEFPIDLEQSRIAGQTIYDRSNGYTTKLRDVSRLNLRLYWRKNRYKKSYMLSLDIQNVLNNENDAFNYYDTFLDEIVLKKQLGIIPILSWRMEF